MPGGDQKFGSSVFLQRIMRRVTLFKMFPVLLKRCNATFIVRSVFFFNPLNSQNQLDFIQQCSSWYLKNIAEFLYVPFDWLNKQLQWRCFCCLSFPKSSYLHKCRPCLWQSSPKAATVLWCVAAKIKMDIQEAGFRHIVLVLLFFSFSDVLKNTFILSFVNNSICSHATL